MDQVTQVAMITTKNMKKTLLHQIHSMHDKKWTHNKNSKENERSSINQVENAAESINRISHMHEIAAT